jgi:hypothetical protein
MVPKVFAPNVVLNRDKACPCFSPMLHYDWRCRVRFVKKQICKGKDGCAQFCAHHETLPHVTKSIQWPGGAPIFCDVFCDVTTPAIPAHCRSRMVSHGTCNHSKSALSDVARVTCAHSSSLVLLFAFMVWRIDTVEVCGSSPHGPTIFFYDGAATERFAIRTGWYRSWQTRSAPGASREKKGCRVFPVNATGTQEARKPGAT